MSPKQTSLYWREFAAALYAYQSTLAGRARSLSAPGGEGRGEVVNRPRHTISAAESSDLRHTWHIQALGQPKSSKSLTNSELDKVLGVFRAISRPDDLDLQLRQQQQDRKRAEFAVRQFEHAYVVSIAHDKFGRASIPPLPTNGLRHLPEALDLSRLDDTQLHQLLITLKARQRQKDSLHFAAADPVLSRARKNIRVADRAMAHHSHSAIGDDLTNPEDPSEPILHETDLQETCNPF